MKVSLNSKFLTLFDKNIRWNVFHGGRSSAKSTSIAIAIVCQMVEEPHTRVICVRQFAKSLRESVYAQIEFACELLKIKNEFKFTADKIQHKNGSVCKFAGIDRNKTSIKGFVNADICWTEEASDINADSWRFLIPTIVRNEGARFFVSFNGDLINDWVWQNFIVTNHYGATVQKINFRENKHNTKAIYETAQQDKERDYDEYLHVWEGHPRVNSRTAVFPLKWIHAAIENDAPEATGKIVAGFDVADEGNDTNALCVAKGNVVRSLEEWHDNDPNSAARFVAMRSKEIGVSKIIFDSIGVGAGAKGEFRRLKDTRQYRDYQLNVEPFNSGMGVRNKEAKYKKGEKNKDTFFNLKAQAYWNLRDKMENSFRLAQGEAIDPEECIFFEKDCELIDKMTAELSAIRFEYKNGKIAIESKKDAKEVSPNVGESIIIAFSTMGGYSTNVWLN